MPQFAFDTLKYVKELEKAGLEPKIAEAQAKEQIGILSNLLDRHAATKDDIKEVKIEIQQTKLELETKIDRLDSRMDRLNSKIDTLEQRLTMRLGRWMLGGVSLIVALMTLFHFI